MGDKTLWPKPSAELQKLWAVERRVLSKPLSNDELKGFGKPKIRLPNPRPFIRFEDLNNKTECDIRECNPKYSSILIGIKGEF